MVPPGGGERTSNPLETAPDPLPHVDEYGPRGQGWRRSGPTCCRSRHEMAWKLQGLLNHYHSLC